MIEVLSYGGGRQTVAMALLVARGVLPQPDRMIIADTGREAQSTWDYLDAYVRPLMAGAGIEVEVAPHTLATVDLYAHNGDLLLPVWTNTGKMQAFCSTEWKQRVVERHLRASGIDGATSWIGFTLDERQRVKGGNRPPWRRRYPLVELMLTRADCERVITDQGWPLPEKSACFMCPHRTNEEWRVIRDRYPEQWAEAIAIDEDIRALDTRGGVYLHASRVPLAEADIDRTDRREPVRQCGMGSCLV